jgi:ribose transport system ATP-binding protein
MSALLELEALSKSWFGVPAVTGVSLAIASGQVLGLIGENGAGKSTLMNMIGGVVPPSSGRMLWQGQPYAPSSAADATARGIAFIHQELNLFGNLSIAENIFINGLPTRFGLVDRAAMHKRTSELLAGLDLDVDPDRRVETLAPGERQIVEIAKALHGEASLIILDEPTTSLTTRETEKLFAVIERLRAGNTAIIYISHILNDVARLSDRIAVMRDGELVSQGPAADYGISAMIRAMIGRDLERIHPPRSAPPGTEAVLSVKGLSQAGIIENITFDIRRGEILGLFGLMGSGRTEMAHILFGLEPAASGEIKFKGASLSGSVRKRIHRGMAFVTENRREEGLMMDATIRENLSLVSIESFGRSPMALIDEDRRARATESVRNRLGVRAGNIATQPARALSGGNQQKVVIGKWLLSDPSVLLLDEPTRGVDVGAKHEIYSIIDILAADGSGILLISSEVEELMGICDRIIVMARGELVGEFVRGAFSEPAILAAAFKET